MTIDELIERLEEYRDELGDDGEVRLASQPSWPLEYSITGLASGAEINDCDDEEEDDDDVEDDNVVYIVEGRQRCYGSQRAWEVAR